MKKNTRWTFLGISLLLHAVLISWLVLGPSLHSARRGTVMEVTLVSSPAKQAGTPTARHTPAERAANRAPISAGEPLRPPANASEAVETHPSDEAGKQAGTDAAPGGKGAADLQAQGGDALQGQPVPAREPRGAGEAAIRSYNQLILSIITRNRFYPDSARRRGIEGSVDVQFTIDKTGRASDVRVVKTSGAEILDRASIQTIRGCSFPPPPAEPVTLPVTITFRLVEGT